MTDYDTRFEAETRQAGPAQNQHAERATLGAMLAAKEAITAVLGTALQGSEYYKPAHETIHTTILDLFAKGEPADPITVAAALEKRGELGRCGGPGYLHDLFDSAPAVANAEYYAEIIREKARLRRIRQALGQSLQQVDEGAGEVSEVVDAIQERVIEAAGTQDPTLAAGLLPIRASISGALDAIEQLQEGSGPVGIPTGFADLDALTGGLHPGQMVIVAGRPSLGKSTAALDIARSAAIKHELGTAFFSLEMSRLDIIKRLISAEARISHHHIQTRGGMTDEDWTRAARAIARIQEAPLYLDDAPDLTMTSIRTKARQMAAEQELKLIIIDYMQLMRSGGGQRHESRQQEVSEISRSIKLLAKELEVPVIALSQLNRGPEQRQDRRPIPADLRESGSLEQDADLIILLHREDAYEKESPRAGEADLIVAKNRSGPTATITVAFQGHYSRFVDFARD